MKNSKFSVSFYADIGDIVFYVRDGSIYLCKVDDIQIKGRNVWYIVMNVTGEKDALTEDNFMKYCFLSEYEAKSKCK